MRYRSHFSYIKKTSAHLPNDSFIHYNTLVKRVTHCSLSMFRYTLLINILYHFTVQTWVCRFLTHHRRRRCRICASRFLQQQRRRKKKHLCLFIALLYLIWKSSSRSGENIYSILAERIFSHVYCDNVFLFIIILCSSINAIHNERARPSAMCNFSLKYWDPV